VLTLVGIGTIGMLTGSIATYFIGEHEEVADPDIAHIRSRLAVWEKLEPRERRQVASMLTAVAEDVHSEA
jgi:voltage-gated potassium channel